MIFAKISWILRQFWVFLYFVFSSPSNHVGTLIWSLSNCTKAQGTLLDLHGPPNGPLNGPSEANFWGPLVKKGPAGSLHGPNWSIFLDRSLDNVQTWIYSLVWGQSDIRFLSNREFATEDDGCAPPPAVIRVNISASRYSSEAVLYLKLAFGSYGFKYN